jgi:hypothetical protein
MPAAPISTAEPVSPGRAEAEGATAPEPVVATAVASAAPPALPTAAEIATEKVEFSEVPTSSGVAKPVMKKIAVESKNVASKLDALRDLYTGKSKDKKQKSREPDPLAALLAGREGASDEVTKKLKIRLEPGEIEAIQNLAVDFHLSGGNIHKRFSNAVTVPLEEKSNPKRVLLKIEIEILKK